MEGYTVFGDERRLEGHLQGRVALVCGNAETVFDDLNRAFYMFDSPVIFAVNDIGCYLGLVNHWVSLHGEKLQRWIAVRRAEPSLWQEFKTHTSSTAIAPADYIWRIEPCTFSLSGLFAAQIAYIMGAEKIILCGCPGDGTRRFFERKPRIDYHYGGGDTPGDMRDRQHFLQELNRVPELRKRLKSMSGRTRTILGGPNS
jgi:hypothetical protein